jgi:hypothetical protein
MRIRHLPEQKKFRLTMSPYAFTKVEAMLDQEGWYGPLPLLHDKQTKLKRRILDFAFARTHRQMPDVRNIAPYAVEVHTKVFMKPACLRLTMAAK